MADDFEEVLETRRRKDDGTARWWEKYLSADELLRGLARTAGEGTRAKPSPPLVERLRAVGREIEAIKQEIEARLALTDRHKRQITYQLAKAESSLLNLQGGMGYNAGVDAKRSFLESQMSTLRTELRTHVERAWKDLLELRRSLRDLIRKYEALKRVLGEVNHGNGRH